MAMVLMFALVIGGFFAYGFRDFDFNDNHYRERPIEANDSLFEELF